jgi:hypothetical protein
LQGRIIVKEAREQEPAPPKILGQRTQKQAENEQIEQPPTKGRKRGVGQQRNEKGPKNGVVLPPAQNL